MSSPDPQVITRRLAVMRTLLDHLDSLDIRSANQLDELSTLLQVERVLTQLVNLAGEINAHVATTRGLPPQDYRDGFTRMADEGVLPRTLTAELRPSVGLRNILTHQYVDLDKAILVGSIPRALRGYDSYVRTVARFLARDL